MEHPAGTWERVPMEEIEPLKRLGGLAEEEEKILVLIGQAHGLYLELEQTHPDERSELVDAVHAFQDLVGRRVLRRAHPDYWTTYRRKG